MSAKIQASEKLDAGSGRALFDEVNAALAGRPGEVEIDLSAVDFIDSMGSAWISRSMKAAGKAGRELRLTGARGRVREILDLVMPGIEAESSETKGASFFESVGETVFSAVDEAKQAGKLLVDTVYWAFLGPFEGKGFRWGSFIEEVHEMGIRAIGIVCLINLLLGLIIAILSAAQLRQFGASIFVADLVVIAFARELAPVMAAVVVSARSGAAIAAEISTMTVQEELDALRAMGLNPTKFLVAPKIWALFLSMPGLVLLANLAGNLGAFLLGITYLDITPQHWWREILGIVEVRDFIEGISKSFVFALIIVLVGCHNGFRVRGGARGVGLSTTRAVVMDITLIIIADMAFAILFNFVLGGGGVGR